MLVMSFLQLKDGLGTTVKLLREFSITQTAANAVSAIAEGINSKAAKSTAAKNTEIARGTTLQTQANIATAAAGPAGAAGAAGTLSLSAAFGKLRVAISAL